MKPSEAERSADTVADPAVEIYGFTGTREGMTEDQKATVMALLDDPAVVEVHHGDCVGADNDFDAIARRQRVGRVIHPPSDNRLRAYCTSEIAPMPEKPYLDRNRDIVDACTALIATPKEYTPQGKGGTWYTVGYARLQGKKVVIVWPDGSTLIDGSEGGSDAPR